jgi:hypothetical protein
MNRPSAVKALMVAIGLPFGDKVGRMIEHAGRFELRNVHGSGKIRLVWNIWLPAC